jgi:hypothetical protein
MDPNENVDAVKFDAHLIRNKKNILKSTQIISKQDNYKLWSYCYGAGADILEKRGDEITPEIEELQYLRQKYCNLASACKNKRELADKIRLVDTSLVDGYLSTESRDKLNYMSDSWVQMPRCEANEVKALLEDTDKLDFFEALNKKQWKK